MLLVAVVATVSDPAVMLKSGLLASVPPVVPATMVLVPVDPE